MLEKFVIFLDFCRDSGLFAKVRGVWFCVPTVPSIFSTMNGITEVCLRCRTFVCTEVTGSLYWWWFWSDFEINESPTVEWVPISVSLKTYLKCFVFLVQPDAVWHDHSIVCQELWLLLLYVCVCQCVSLGLKWAGFRWKKESERNQDLATFESKSPGTDRCWKVCFCCQTTVNQIWSNHAYTFMWSRLYDTPYITDTQ